LGSRHTWLVCFRPKGIRIGIQAFNPKKKKKKKKKKLKKIYKIKKYKDIFFKKKKSCYLQYIQPRSK